MADKKLHLVLNAREQFSPVGAGASALNVIGNARHSRYRDNITVFGPPTRDPYRGVAFHALPMQWRPFQTRHDRIARSYILYAKDNPPDLIEVFNRPSMSLTIAKSFPKIPVMARLGNDARKQDGMKSPKRRRELLARCTEIHCSSQYIRDCFLDGVDASEADVERVRIVYLGIERPAARPHNKEPEIVFVGRVLQDKGVLPLVQSLAAVLPRHPQWSAKIIGARAFRPSEKASPYERAVAQTAASCPQIDLAGFQTHDVAMQALKKASIAVVPSLWDEPFGRAAAEALANGCALISSGRGGLREIAEGRGILIDDVNTETLSVALERLITDNAERAKLQAIAWTNFPFDIRERVEEWDSRRDAMLASNR